MLNENEVLTAISSVLGLYKRLNAAAQDSAEVNPAYVSDDGEWGVATSNAAPRGIMCAYVRVPVDESRANDLARTWEGPMSDHVMFGAPVEVTYFNRGMGHGLGGDGWYVGIDWYRPGIDLMRADEGFFDLATEDVAELSRWVGWTFGGNNA